MAGRPFLSSLEWSTGHPSKVSRMLGNKTCQKPAASASGCAGLISLGHVGQIRMKTNKDILIKRWVIPHDSHDTGWFFWLNERSQFTLNTLNVSNNGEENRNYSALIVFLTDIWGYCVLGTLDLSHHLAGNEPTYWFTCPCPWPWYSVPLSKGWFRGPHRNHPCCLIRGGSQILCHQNHSLDYPSGVFDSWFCWSYSWNVFSGSSQE